MADLQLYLLSLLIMNTCVICLASKEQWVMIREMSKTGYEIMSVEKISDSKNQTYICRIRAPKPTWIRNDRTFLAFYGNVEMKQVSVLNDGVSAVYEAKVSTSLETILTPPVVLTSGPETLKLDFSPFVTRDKQVSFKFNNCQFQVERKDEIGTTTYKFTMWECRCRRSFSGSIGKMTASGFKETWGFSPPYVFPFHEYLGSNVNGQLSSIFINRTALEENGVKLNSLKFLIEREQDDLYLDFIDSSEYGFSLS